MSAPVRTLYHRAVAYHFLDRMEGGVVQDGEATEF
jgi:hypothetical protein